MKNIARKLGGYMLVYAIAIIAIYVILIGLQYVSKLL